MSDDVRLELKEIEVEAAIYRRRHGDTRPWPHKGDVETIVLRIGADNDYYLELASAAVREVFSDGGIEDLFEGRVPVDEEEWTFEMKIRFWESRSTYSSYFIDDDYECGFEVLEATRVPPEGCYAG